MTKEQKALIDAAMRLWHSRRAHLQHQPHGLDCEGEYWIIRDTAPMRSFRTACRRLEKLPVGPGKGSA